MKIFLSFQICQTEQAFNDIKFSGEKKQKCIQLRFNAYAFIISIPKNHWHFAKRKNYLLFFNSNIPTTDGYAIHDTKGKHRMTKTNELIWKRKDMIIIIAWWMNTEYTNNLIWSEWNYPCQGTNQRPEKKN